MECRTNAIALQNSGCKMQSRKGKTTIGDLLGNGGFVETDVGERAAEKDSEAVWFFSFFFF